VATILKVRAADLTDTRNESLKAVAPIAVRVIGNNRAD
jgi:hypothetical protein